MSFSVRHTVLTRLMRFQKGYCAFCGDKLNTPVIDHDHDTDLVRGLLCTRCNTEEGKAPADHPRWNEYWSNTPASQIGISVYYSDIS